MRVEVTEEHIALLRRMHIRWNDEAYDGAPEVNLKRPYGNSDVTGDVAEILDWELGTDRYGDPMMTQEQAERAMTLHREMEAVLQVLVHNPLTFALGVWVNTSKAAPYGVEYTREER